MRKVPVGVAFMQFVIQNVDTKQPTAKLCCCFFTNTPSPTSRQPIHRKKVCWGSGGQKDFRREMKTLAATTFSLNRQSPLSPCFCRCALSQKKKERKIVVLLAFPENYCCDCGYDYDDCGCCGDDVDVSAWRCFWWWSN